MNIALIPARGGSKGVPRKNIKLLYEYPLIAYSIAVAKSCKNIDRVIVSTNSEEIGKTAKIYGAEVPFMRPEIYSTDSATAYDVVRHFCEWYFKTYCALPDLIVILLPTTPLRDERLVSHAISRMMNEPFSSLRSVHKLAEPPQKMMKIENGFLTGFFPNVYVDKEYWNLPRQGFPDAYHPNGYVEIVRPEVVMNEGRILFGANILPYVTDHVVEVDQPEDFEYLEYILEKKGHRAYDLLNSCSYKI